MRSTKLRLFTPADIKLISEDPELSKEYHPGFGDFRTDYLGFGTSNKPFNDIKVREAFAKAVDRDALIKNVIKQAGHPGLLLPDARLPRLFDRHAEERGRQQATTAAAAKKLLADAGYPDGKGFPAQQLWLRNEAT